MIRWILLGIGILIVVFVIYQHLIQRHLQVVHLTVKPARAGAFAKELPGRILVFADLHNDTFGKDNVRLTERIREQNPEMILIPGDLLIGRRKNFHVASDLLRKLNELGVPMYLSLGNHETGTMEHKPELYEEFLKEASCENLHVLDNRCEHCSEHVAICGLTLPMEVYGKRGRRYRVTDKELSKISPAPAGDVFIILLAHTPYYFDSYVSYGADLVVSGHVHGGIVRLPFLGGVISPQMELFPKYDAGIYEKDGTVLAVTRGLGTHFPPIRIANRPEILVLDIEK